MYIYIHTGGIPHLRKTSHLFIKLPLIEAELNTYVKSTATLGSWSQNCVSITNGWLSNGLKPRCITRDLKWGTPVPVEGYEKKVGYLLREREKINEKEEDRVHTSLLGFMNSYSIVECVFLQVFYVWFDAPIGYISITAEYTADWREWWQNPENVEMVQFMGKDNVPFHTVIFPSTLIGESV